MLMKVAETAARVHRISVQNLDHVIGQYLIDILSRSGIRKTKNSSILWNWFKFNDWEAFDVPRDVKLSL